MFWDFSTYILQVWFAASKTELDIKWKKTSYTSYLTNFQATYDLEF